MKRLILGSLIVLWVAGLGFAQIAQDSWDNLRQLQAGQKIEVVDMKMKSVKGTFVSLTDDTISLQAKKKETSLAREDVFRVSVRGQSHRVRNTLIGLALGVGVGVAIPAASAAAHNDPDYGVIGLATLPVGAGVGALVGAAIPTGEQTIYRVNRKK